MTDAVTASEKAAPRRSASWPTAEPRATLGYAQWRALRCLAQILEEPYTGDASVDASIRKAKIAAANTVLAVDNGFHYAALWGD